MYMGLRSICMMSRCSKCCDLPCLHTSVAMVAEEVRDETSQWRGWWMSLYHWITTAKSDFFAITTLSDIYLPHGLLTASGRAKRRDSCCSRRWCRTGSSQGLSITDRWRPGDFVLLCIFPSRCQMILCCDWQHTDCEGAWNECWGLGRRNEMKDEHNSYESRHGTFFCVMTSNDGCCLKVQRPSNSSRGNYKRVNSWIEA